MCGRAGGRAGARRARAHARAHARVLAPVMASQRYPQLQNRGVPQSEKLGKAAACGWLNSAFSRRNSPLATSIKRDQICPDSLTPYTEPTFIVFHPPSRNYICQTNAKKRILFESWHLRQQTSSASLPRRPGMGIPPNS